MSDNDIDIMISFEKKIKELSICKKFEDNPVFSLSFITTLREKFIESLKSSNSSSHTNRFTVQDKALLYLDSNSYIRVSWPNDNTLILTSYYYDKEKNIKHLLEETAIIDENGNIKLSTFKIALSNNNCRYNESICDYTEVINEYNNNGIETSRLTIKNKPLLFHYSLEKLSPTDALIYIKDKQNQLRYDKIELITRKYLDIAEYKLLNNDEIIYHSLLPINNDMIHELNVDKSLVFQDNIHIKPLSREEIERKIKNINNKKIIEGLNKEIKDRERFTYDSNLDDNFINVRSMTSNITK